MGDCEPHYGMSRNLGRRGKTSLRVQTGISPQLRAKAAKHKEKRRLFSQIRSAKRLSRPIRTKGDSQT
jgi:hypothetical protein